MVTRSQSIRPLERKYRATPALTRIAAVIARRRVLVLPAIRPIQSFRGPTEITERRRHCARQFVIFQRCTEVQLHARMRPARGRTRKRQRPVGQLAFDGDIATGEGRDETTRDLATVHFEFEPREAGFVRELDRHPPCPGFSRCLRPGVECHTQREHCEQG